ncbi:unnamed protein product, partial [Mesorhabditis belari]|uniref:C-type lectin domain-containing protein n=1 Tax=Mesorhabditis belari TaxID=2138241 RepID=A0A915GSM2_9BILA
MFKIVFLFSISFFVYTIEAACPNGMIPILNETKCLYQSPDYQDADQAILICQQIGGQNAGLAKIDNSFENGFAWQLIRNLAPFLIGVKQTANGVWTQWDGKPLTYTNWAPGEPNSIVGCAAIDSSNGQWKAVNCYFRNSYFCTV